jgi:hypothetical protein
MKLNRVIKLGRGAPGPLDIYRGVQFHNKIEIGFSMAL